MAEHAIQIYKSGRVYGLSFWDIHVPGSRLRIPQQRATRIYTVDQLKKWAKRYTDINPKDIADAEAHIDSTNHNAS